MLGGGGGSSLGIFGGASPPPNPMRVPTVVLTFCHSVQQTQQLAPLLPPVHQPLLLQYSPQRRRQQHLWHRRRPHPLLSHLDRRAAGATPAGAHAVCGGCLAVAQSSNSTKVAPAARSAPHIPSRSGQRTRQSDGAATAGPDA